MAGRLAQADGIYREILADDPQHGQALCLSGMLAQQRGDGTRALQLLTRCASSSSLSRRRTITRR